MDFEFDPGAGNVNCQANNHLAVPQTISVAYRYLC